jgi:hypothetical protein
MNATVFTAVLFADSDRWESLFRGLSNGFQDRGYPLGTTVPIAIVLAAFIAVVVLLFAIDGRKKKKLGFGSPRTLFISLCKAHKLGLRESWWIWRLGRSQQLRNPALLFVEPHRWQAAEMNSWPESRRRRLTKLRERLFAERG